MQDPKPTLQSVLLKRVKVDPALLPPGKPPDPTWDPRKYEQ